MNVLDELALPDSELTAGVWRSELTCVLFTRAFSLSFRFRCPITHSAASLAAASSEIFILWASAADRLGDGLESGFGLAMNSAGEAVGSLTVIRCLGGVGAFVNNFGDGVGEGRESGSDLLTTLPLPILSFRW